MTKDELSKLFKEILEEDLGHIIDFDEYPDDLSKLVERLVCVAIEPKRVTLPPGSGIDWLIASGAKPEEVQKTLDKEAKIREVTQAYEKFMGYSPLEWSKLERLQRFLLTKSVEDIQTFARWSKREYSVFRPEKARLYPNMVIEMWPLAFEKATAEQDKTQDAIKEALYGKSR